MCLNFCTLVGETIARAWHAYARIKAIKDAYPIPLIEEALVQLKSAEVFTKIDIRQAFYKF